MFTEVGIHAFCVCSQRRARRAKTRACARHDEGGDRYGVNCNCLNVSAIIIINKEVSACEHWICARRRDQH
jgi:hypothetical protein